MAVHNETNGCGSAALQIYSDRILVLITHFGRSNQMTPSFFQSDFHSYSLLYWQITVACQLYHYCAHTERHTTAKVRPAAQVSEQAWPL